MSSNTDSLDDIKDEYGFDVDSSEELVDAEKLLGGELVSDSVEVAEGADADADLGENELVGKQVETEIPFLNDIVEETSQADIAGDQIVNESEHAPEESISENTVESEVAAPDSEISELDKTQELHTNNIEAGPLDMTFEDDEDDMANEDTATNDNDQHNGVDEYDFGADETDTADTFGEMNEEAEEIVLPDDEQENYNKDEFIVSSSDKPSMVDKINYDEPKSKKGKLALAAVLILGAVGGGYFYTKSGAGLDGFLDDKGVQYENSFASNDEKSSADSRALFSNSAPEIVGNDIPSSPFGQEVQTITLNEGDAESPLQGDIYNEDTLIGSDVSRPGFVSDSEFDDYRNSVAATTQPELDVFLLLSKENREAIKELRRGEGFSKEEIITLLSEQNEGLLVQVGNQEKLLVALSKTVKALKKNEGWLVNRLKVLEGKKVASKKKSYAKKKVKKATPKKKSVVNVARNQITDYGIRGIAETTAFIYHKKSKQKYKVQIGTYVKGYGAVTSIDPSNSRVYTTGGFIQ